MKTTDRFHDQIVISPEEYYEANRSDGFRSLGKRISKKLEPSDDIVGKRKSNSRVERREKG